MGRVVLEETDWREANGRDVRYLMGRKGLVGRARSLFGSRKFWKCSSLSSPGLGGRRIL